MTTKKRGALGNPALSYLSGTQEPQEAKQPTNEISQSTIPSSSVGNIGGQATNYKEMLKQVEARSKRIQCLLQPSLYDKVKAIANQRGVSLNDLVHGTLEALAEQEGK